MPDIRKRKSLLYFVICMVLISFIHAVPVENPVTASAAAIYQREKEDIPIAHRMLKEFSIAAVMPVVSFEAMNTKNVSFGDTLVYRAPVENENISEGKEESHESEGRTMRSRRYHVFRFLTVVFTMFLLPSVVVHISLLLYGSSYIELWKDIYYIHWIDGKKGRRLSVLLG